jgi:hypothetical protein
MTHMTRDSCFVSSTLSQQLEAAAANCVEASAHLGSAIGCLRRVPDRLAQFSSRKIEDALARGIGFQRQVMTDPDETADGVISRRKP